MKFDLKVRDLINIGVFTVIYILVLFIFSSFAMFAPWMMFVGWTFSIILDGIVVIFLLARTPKMGALTVMGLFAGLLMLTSGHFWATTIACVVLGFIADMVASERGYAQRLNPTRGIIAYAIFTLWYVLPLLPYLLNSHVAFEHAAERSGAEKAAQIEALFQPWVIGIWSICLIILALIGGWLGTRVAKKHFQRAGLTR